MDATTAAPPVATPVEQIIAVLSAHQVPIGHVHTFPGQDGPLVSIETTQDATAATLLDLLADDPDNPAPTYTGQYAGAHVCVYRTVQYAVVDDGTQAIRAQVRSWPAAKALAEASTRPAHVEPVPR